MMRSRRARAFVRVPLLIATMAAAASSSGCACFCDFECAPPPADAGAGGCGTSSNPDDRFCGDESCNAGETCLSCVDDCGDCPPQCGDGVLNDEREACDGLDFGSVSCETEGFTGGRPTCDAACAMSLADCTLCGDEEIEGTERCDGANLGGFDCPAADPAFAGGMLACAADCADFDTTGCRRPLVEPPNDYDGDGLADLAVGAPDDTTGGAGAGRVYVFSAAPGGPSTTPVLILEGIADGRVGAALAAADFDGDAFTDLAVGAPGDGAGAFAGGAVFIHRGGAGGLDPVPAAVLSGTTPGDQLGLVLAAPGDLDGDGLGDLLVGVPSASTAGANAGAVMVYLGVAGALFADPPTATIDGAPDDRLGAAIAAAGDLDGDTYADFITGAPGLGGPGSVHFYRGGPGPGFDAGPDAVMVGPAGAYFGQAVAVGDLNGDGLPDVAVGAPGEVGPGGFAGVVYLAFGASPGPLDPAPLADATFAPATLGVGLTLAASGDLDGDGFADLASGSPSGSAVALWRGGADFALDAAPDLLLEVAGLPSLGLGHALGYADLDADALADLVMGAENGPGVAGSVQIYLGNAWPFAPPASTPLAGASADDGFGLAVE